MISTREVTRLVLGWERDYRTRFDLANVERVRSVQATLRYASEHAGSACGAAHDHMINGISEVRLGVQVGLRLSR